MVTPCLHRAVVVSNPFCEFLCYRYRHLPTEGVQTLLCCLLRPPALPYPPPPRSARLKRYCLRPDLNARMPGYKISMGFGLHVGWAIEGAIGAWGADGWGPMGMGGNGARESGRVPS